VSWRRPWPEPAASAVGSAPGDSCIDYEEPMATQHQVDCEESMATQRQIESKHPSRDTDSIGLIRAVDPVANDWHLMKSIDPWAGAGGSDPRCCGHILRIFLKENNSINPKNHWNLKFCKNNHELFHNYILVTVILYLGPCLTFYN
jgi:hypothetical protein